MATKSLLPAKQEPKDKLFAAPEHLSSALLLCAALKEQEIRGTLKVEELIQQQTKIDAAVTQAESEYQKTRELERIITKLPGEPSSLIIAL